MWANANIVGSNFGSGALFGPKNDCAAQKNRCDEPVFVIHAERAVFREREPNLAELKTHNALVLRFDAVAVINRRTGGGIVAVQTRVHSLKHDAGRRCLRQEGFS